MKDEKENLIDDLPANQPREYFNRVDFSCACANWCLRGEFMIHIDRHLISHFVKLFQEVALFKTWNVEIQPYFTGTRTCIVLKLMTSINIVGEVHDLLYTITNDIYFKNTDIVYKEGLFGYDVNSNGTILKKWDLDDGMC